jgi:ribosomal protein S18 acetylase RimI-like enzyme
MAHIKQAGIEDIESIIPLFTAYRAFYNIESDPVELRDYLYERLKNNQCVIFLASIDEATTDTAAVGFTQLYPGFSSLSLKNTWTLNDLYVAPEARRLLVGQQLMDRAKQMAKESGACELMPQTATDNITAQGLYEKLGYERDNDFYCYCLDLED